MNVFSVTISKLVKQSERTAVSISSYFSLSLTRSLTRPIADFISKMLFIFHLWIALLFHLFTKCLHPVKRIFDFTKWFVSSPFGSFGYWATVHVTLPISLSLSLFIQNQLCRVFHTHKKQINVSAKFLAACTLARASLNISSGWFFFWVTCGWMFWAFSETIQRKLQQ